MEESDADDDSEKYLEDDYTEVPMDIVTSPVETRKGHTISCPVCYEIFILSKQSNLYDNIIAACIEKNSNK